MMDLFKQDQKKKKEGSQVNWNGLYKKTKHYLIVKANIRNVLKQIRVNFQIRKFALVYS